ncbi:hypothetical protein FE374_15115 [Georgenia yuyongxinii]|uniref:Lanthionine synthetase C family protein n=1 Tax=Georgenia yuyongxinii TaxID=2589797 RepID=A0A5B8C583_9MICO|nr:hypothetical protein [Georgenia yuyongxinii]QDC25763.1 hypothetical protein FE374_15115 [Georgenia yuyongxinii]
MTVPSLDVTPPPWAGTTDTASAAGIASTAGVGPRVRRSAVQVLGAAGPRGDGTVLPWTLGARERPDCALDLADLRRLGRAVRRLAGGIAVAATPSSPDALFADDLPAGQSAGFARGAAGVLWALAEVGADIPGELVEWLVRAARRAPRDQPGLANGLSGLALALDRLGCGDEAAELWSVVEKAPLGELGPTLADGLPGLGLALLERAPVLDGEALLDRVETVAAALVRQLRWRPRLDRLGVLRGGSGAALFLLHAYELTEDPTLVEPIEDCLRHDLALLGWRPFARHAALPLWSRPGSVANGSMGVAVVLHHAAQHLDAPWVAEAAEAITAAAEQRLREAPGLSRGRASAILALQYLRSLPWETAEERFARVRPYLEPVTLRRAPNGAAPAGGFPVGLEDGAAGVLLALGHLGTAGDRRVPFLW